MIYSSSFSLHLYPVLIASFHMLPGSLGAPELASLLTWWSICNRVIMSVYISWVKIAHTGRVLSMPIHVTLTKHQWRAKGGWGAGEITKRISRLHQGWPANRCPRKVCEEECWRADPPLPLLLPFLLPPPLPSPPLILICLVIINDRGNQYQAYFLLALGTYPLAVILSSSSLTRASYSSSLSLCVGGTREKSLQTDRT